MKKMIIGVFSWISMSLYLLLSSCAGTDGSGFDNGTSTPTPSPQASITRGKLENVDVENQQITINGVSFNVQPEAVIQVNGQRQALDNLKTNQVVTIKSVVGNGSVNLVEQINYISQCLRTC